MSAPNRSLRFTDSSSSIHGLLVAHSRCVQDACKEAADLGYQNLAIQKHQGDIGEVWRDLVTVDGEPFYEVTTTIEATDFPFRFVVTAERIELPSEARLS